MASLTELHLVILDSCRRMRLWRENRHLLLLSLAHAPSLMCEGVLLSMTLECLANLYFVVLYKCKMIYYFPYFLPLTVYHPKIKTPKALQACLKKAGVSVQDGN